MILVVSHADDDHTRAVLEQLHQLGAAMFLFNLSAFPGRTSLSLSYTSEIGQAFTLRSDTGQVVDPGFVPRRTVAATPALSDRSGNRQPCRTRLHL